jgi:hypothetical protein
MQAYTCLTHTSASLHALAINMLSTQTECVLIGGMELDKLHQIGMMQQACIQLAQHSTH